MRDSDVSYSRILVSTLLLLASFIALSGCESAIVNSRSSNNILAKAGNAPVEGLVYSLPRRLVKLTAERKLIDDQTAKKEKADLNKAIKALDDEITKFDERLKIAQDVVRVAKIEEAKASADIKVSVTERRAVAENTAAALEDIVKELKKKKAEKEGDVADLDMQRGKFSEAATIELLAVEPDANAQYVAHLNHEPWHDDDIKLEVSNGLLSTSDVTSTDQTPAIILSVVKSFAAVTSPVQLQGWQEKKESSGVDCTEYKFERTFDLTDPAEWNKMRSALNDASQNSLVVEMTAPDGTTFSTEADAVVQGNTTSPETKCTIVSRRSDAYRSPRATIVNRCGPDLDKGVGGVVYRVALPYRVDVASSKKQQCKGTIDYKTVSASIMLPNKSATYFLPMTAGAFTKSTAFASFKDGMPVSYKANRPSEIAGFVSLPVDIAKAIISVPTEMLQLKVDYSSKDTALTQAQKNALDAEIALIEAQRRYEEALAAQRSAAE